MPHFEQFEELAPAPDEAIVEKRAGFTQACGLADDRRRVLCSFRELPARCGVDGVEFIDDGY
jgi:hypothetical protein